MTQKSWRIEEAFPRFVKTQAAKGVTDKTILTYNRHFHALSYHLDMTKTFDELTKDDPNSMLVSLRKSGVSTATPLPESTLWIAAGMPLCSKSCLGIAPLP